MLAVLGALFANGLITVLKFMAAVVTGSSGMMAEALSGHDIFRDGARKRNDRARADSRAYRLRGDSTDAPLLFDEREK